MTRRAGLMILLALALGWLAYRTWSPQWLEQWTERAAISDCGHISESEHLDLAQIAERRARCRAMQAEYDRKWN
jgi:hypothetical protein